jgi:NAD+ synthase
MNRRKFIVEAAGWIRDKVRRAGAKGVVLGVSGGVDSAVAAALCRRAVGRDKLLCLLLPCHTPVSETEDSRLVCRALNVKCKSQDLTPVFDHLVRMLPPADKKTTSNLKPRLRMLTLYFFANRHNYIVAGTGNRSELTLGYFTKYGDGGADILPIGGLLKREVRELARELGIPPKIILKRPTAGLWPGQTDEGEMGLAYEYIDGVLNRRGGWKKHGNKKIRKMAQRALHKLSVPEVFIAGKVSHSMGRRLFLL